MYILVFVAFKHWSLKRKDRQAQPELHADSEGSEAVLQLVRAQSSMQSSLFNYLFILSTVSWRAAQQMSGPRADESVA